MRYECINCGAGGGSAKDATHLTSPASYNCHVCGAKEAMRPYPEDRRALVRQIEDLDQVVGKYQEALHRSRKRREKLEQQNRKLLAQVQRLQQLRDNLAINRPAVAVEIETGGPWRAIEADWIRFAAKFDNLEMDRPTDSPHLRPLERLPRPFLEDLGYSVPAFCGIPAVEVPQDPSRIEIDPAELDRRFRAPVFTKDEEDNQ